MRKLFRRLHYWLRRRQYEAELQEEIELHRTLKQRELEASGLPAAQAAYSSKRAMGNATLAREDARAVWIVPWIEQGFSDLRYGWRAMRRTPWVTAIALSSLALGIGATTAVFSVFNAAFIRTLYVDRPEQLVALNHVNSNGTFNQWSVPFFTAYQARQKSFQGIFAISLLQDPALSTDAESNELISQVNGSLISWNAFPILNVHPETGRAFTADDDQFFNPGSVMLLSDRIWRQKFRSDPAIIGRGVFLFGNPFTVIGVMPEGFSITGEDFWIPLNTQPIVSPEFDRRTNPGMNWLEVMGRLKPDGSLQQAQSEADVLYPQMVSERKIVLQMGQQATLRLTSGSRGFGDIERIYGRPLRLLMSAVGLLLLIACVNIASLLLARSGSREREFAVRRALGCGRTRLLRQLLVETLLFALIGGAVGLALAPAAAHGLVTVAAPSWMQGIDVSIDARVLLFTFVISMASALIFGLPPAIRSSGTSIGPALKSSPRTTTVSGQRLLLNRGFLSTQVALSVIVVAMSVLFGQSLYRLYTLDPGFDGHNVITASISGIPLDSSVVSRDAQSSELARRLSETLLTLPGVKSFSMTGCGIMTRCSGAIRAVVEDSQVSSDPIRLQSKTVSRGFFDTFRIPIVLGRGFSADDRVGSPRVAVVNETFAREHFKGGSPLGKRFWANLQRSGEPVQIVGVVKDSKYASPRETTLPLAFLSFEQSPGTGVQFVQIRLDGSLQSVLPQIQSVIREVDPRLRVGLETVEQSFDQTVAFDIMAARLSGVFGALALLLACLGVYGVISYIVTTRTAEIGIRLAIGARPNRILGEVIGQAIRTVAPGIVVGIGLSLVAERLIETLLFDFEKRDPIPYVMVAAILLGATGVAAFFPARRASQIDPSISLRCE